MHMNTNDSYEAQAKSVSCDEAEAVWFDRGYTPVVMRHLRCCPDCRETYTGVREREEAADSARRRGEF